ncbi:MAG: FAD binding domain-containing protein [Deltaproteobacteria bacterium]|nr:FAD binding domain-containing protein [Deltaproteobacteria bacterium]
MTTSYLRPTTLDEALAALATTPTARVLAGGTDWMIPARAGAVPDALINIFRVEQLRSIRRTGDALELGACVTVAQLLKSKDVLQAAPVLWKAADRFASPLVRSRATLGGNLCNASPAADLSLALLACDATVTLASKGGRRSLTVEELVLGPRKTALGPGELLVGVRVPIRAGQVSRFEKSGPRPALEISAAAVAFTATVEGGRLTGVRIACGAVAPVPMRAKKAEALVEGRALDPALIEAAVEAAAGEVTPIDDVRATARYRRRLVAAYVRRCLEACTDDRRLHAAAS